MCLDTPVSSADVVTSITCSQINEGREQGASHTLLLRPVYLVSPQCPDSCTSLTQLWHPLPTAPHCQGGRWTAWQRVGGRGCAQGYLRNDNLVSACQHLRELGRSSPLSLAFPTWNMGVGLRGRHSALVANIKVSKGLARISCQAGFLQIGYIMAPAE